MIKLVVQSHNMYAHSTNYGIPKINRLTFYRDGDCRQERTELRNALKVFPLETKILIRSWIGEGGNQDYFVFNKLTEDDINKEFVEDFVNYHEINATKLIANGTLFEDENRPEEYFFITTVGELLLALTYPIKEE